MNHLEHQALVQELLPLLMRGTAPRLVVTASEVYDPTTAGGKVQGLLKVCPSRHPAQSLTGFSWSHPAPDPCQRRHFRPLLQPPI